MKILITGTHFTTAQAVIEKLKHQKQIELVYVGRKNTREGDSSVSAESQIIPKLGVRFIPITTGRLQRSFTRYTILSLLKIPWGMISALRIILKEKPAVIVAFGGYVSVPIVVIGKFFSIPIIIHEQTLVMGLANRVCSIFANKIAISFAPVDSQNQDQRVVLTGNPIRADLLLNNKDKNQFSEIIQLSKDSKLPLILVIGGNQGSHIINEMILANLNRLNKSVCMIHQTGDSKFQDCEKAADKKNKLEYPRRYVPIKWIDSHDLGGVLKNADLAISRAGANTLTELAYFGVPGLVIPYPFLNQDEQAVNATYFNTLGLVEVIPQSGLRPHSFLSKILLMLENRQMLKERAKNARSIVALNAADRLANEILALVRSHKFNES